MGFSGNFQAFIVPLGAYSVPGKPPVHQSYPFIYVIYFSFFNADRVVIWLINGLPD
jgi:hypothetical protein